MLVVVSRLLLQSSQVVADVVVVAMALNDVASFFLSRDLLWSRGFTDVLSTFIGDLLLMCLLLLLLLMLLLMLLLLTLLLLTLLCEGDLLLLLLAF